MIAQRTRHSRRSIREIDAAILPMLSRMEQNGMRIDREHFRRLSADLDIEMDKLRDQLSAICGEKNPNSPRLADILFRKFGLPSIKLTKSGARESIDDDVLSVLLAELKKSKERGASDPLIDEAMAVISTIQSYRELQKLKTTNCEPLLEHADGNDRVHTHIYYYRSVSRLSSGDPVNLQNLPNPDNSPIWGARVREGFVARPGYKLISADYSQIELVVGAHLTQDRNLLEAFRNGEDLHCKVASKYLGVPIHKDDPRRTQFKPVNFGAFYDISPGALQVQLAMLGIEKTEAECAEMLRWYFTEFAPEVPAWKDRVRRDAQADGMVRTMFGRMRWIPGLRSQIKRVRSAAERECTNFPVQGSAGDILRIGMAVQWEDVLPMMWAEGMDIEPVMTVHDEMLYEAREEDAELAGWMLGEAMRGAVELSVPVKVGVGIGDSWAGAH